MKLALLGYPIKHSLSPKLYQQFLGDQLESYDLLEVSEAKLIPSLDELARKYNGLNITAPYKSHFVSKVIIESELVKSLGAINTISFTAKGIKATNTDVMAVESILKDFVRELGTFRLIILGNGVMAKLTLHLAQALNLPCEQYSRSQGSDLQKLDLSHRIEKLLIANTCSRDFVFKGRLPSDCIFWDYNYSFLPHQNTLPSQVKAYIDGEEMLKRQAIAAVRFWQQTQP